MRFFLEKRAWLFGFIVELNPVTWLKSPLSQMAFCPLPLVLLFQLENDFFGNLWGAFFGTNCIKVSGISFP